MNMGLLSGVRSHFRSLVKKAAPRHAQRQLTLLDAERMVAAAREVLDGRAAARPGMDRITAIARRHRVGPSRLQSFVRRLSPHPLNVRIEVLLPFSEETPAAVLDVGAGPVSRFGTQVQQGNIELTAIDVLADQYAAMLDRHGIVPPVRTCPGDVYSLAGRFGDKSFDAVVSFALMEKLECPVDALRQRLRVCRDGGVVYMHETGGDVLEALDGEHDLRIRSNGRSVRVSELHPDCYCYTVPYPTATAYFILLKGPDRGQIRRAWQNGKREAIEWWDKTISNAGPDHRFRERLDPDRKLVPSLRAIAKHLSLEAPRILDVGAGPATNIGYMLKRTRLDITPIDVLAEEYSAILARCGMSPPAPTRFGEAEHLDRLFEPESFDIIHSRNALDHVFDPVESVRQMLRVCRKGGAVFIQGHVNEGVTEGYQGYHQWNFMWEGDEFVIWRPFQRHLLSEIAAPHHVRRLPRTRRDPAGAWYKVMIEKV